MHPVNKSKMIMEDLNISSVLFYPRDWSFSCHRIWRGPIDKVIWLSVNQFCYYYYHTKK